MAIKLYRSQAQIDTKSTNVSASNLSVSPSTVYSSTKASAGAADAAVNLFAVVKKTKDDNKATAINNDIEQKMGKLSMNYDRSSNPEDITAFNSMMSLVKDKAILGANNSVKRKVNSNFASKLSSYSLQLEKKITTNVIDEKKATDKIELEKLKGEIALNKQAILALGFMKPGPEGQATEETPMVLEQLKASTEAINQQFEQRQSAEQMRRQSLDSDRRYQMQQREMAIREEELRTRQQVAQKELQVAETNKNRYDIQK